MKRKTVMVRVSKTVQVRQFEPVTVVVEEVADISADEDQYEAEKELYKSVSKAVEKFMKNEVKQWRE